MLSQVKSIIVERKKKSAMENVQDYNHRRANTIRSWGKKPAGIPARTGTFPNIKATRLHHLDNEPRDSNLPSSETDKVRSTQGDPFPFIVLTPISVSTSLSLSLSVSTSLSLSVYLWPPSGVSA
jgi:hypothetical protein